VHSYGTCLHNRDEPSPQQIPDDPRWPAIAQRRARKIKVLSHYKFYLAFENAPIDDYVSEKVSGAGLVNTAGL
jgi:negative regulator of replication initiation